MTKLQPEVQEILDEVERRARAAAAGSRGLPWEAVHAQIQKRLIRLEQGL